MFRNYRYINFLHTPGSVDITPNCGGVGIQKNNNNECILREYYLTQKKTETFREKKIPKHRNQRSNHSQEAGRLPILMATCTKTADQ